jgi:hypothetical protein
MPRRDLWFQKACQKPNRQGGPDPQALVLKGLAACSTTIDGGGERRPRLRAGF